MRRLLLGIVVLILVVPGCVTHKPAPAARPPVVRDARPAYPPPAPPPPRQAEPAPQYSGATWYPAGRAISPRWTTVVIHHSATPTGSARAFDRFHRGKGWDELGYHFVIGNGTGSPDGAIEVGPRWHKQKHGAHCKTPSNYYNEHGVGICLVGDFTKSRPTPRQLASLQQLVRFLCSSCRISPDRVTTHGSVKHGTLCPGKNFPIRAVRSAVAGPATAAAYR
ncbi:MAG: N-acetylmuramoyl-L-alanine amidase [Planctomycetes bacterium]|nr:N-acetylmuramoyl-L-alanine amidase [Planctomycetota bacterium]